MTCRTHQSEQERRPRRRQDWWHRRRGVYQIVGQSSCHQVKVYYGNPATEERRVQRVFKTLDLLRNGLGIARVPEFGPLAHHFELFMTNCFQGTFVSRATGFRVGLIKSRFCKVVLTQFMHEVDIQGALAFRSQWDVAALARVFYTLGVGNEEVFWKQFVDGGQIGAEFMAKAHGTLDMAVHDGPLLNFVKLGHLATTSLPFEGSGLEDGEFGKLVNLLQKMRDDSALPCLLEQSRSAQPECASSIPPGASRLLVSHSPPLFHD